MPWSESDAGRHTKRAKSAKDKRRWAAVANSILKQTGNEGRAVRGANAVVGRHAKYGLDSVGR